MIKMNNDATHVTMNDAVMVDGMVQLMALVESEDEAIQMADELSINFETYSYGVATFTTDKNPETVINEAKKKKLPNLSIDRVQKAF